LGYMIATIVITIVSIILIIAIVVQQSKSSGLSSGLSGGSDTYWSRNRGRSKEGKLERITLIAGIVFMVLAVILNIGLFKNM